MSRLTSRAVWCATLAAAGIGLVPPAARAQEVTVGIELFNPTPYLADWSAKPGLGAMVVGNTTGFDIDLTVTATLLKNGVPVGQAGSDITQLPATASQYYPLPDVARWTQMVFTGAVKQAVQQSGRLPEGTYWLRITFSNMSTSSGRGLLDVQDSTSFVITFPQPPKLVSPANGSTVLGPYPTFQWTPVIAPGVSVAYAVKVVEVLPGQTPLQAVQANVPVVQAPVVNVTTLLYPPSAYTLEPGTTYAWRVQAVSFNPLEFEPPQPIGANNGFSEVFTFKLAPPTGAVVVVVPPPPPPPQPKGPIVVQGGGPPYNRVLAGKIEYTFNRFDVPDAKKISLAFAGQLPVIPLMEAGGSTPPPVAGAATAPLPSGAQAASVGPPGPSRRPLGGVTVRLVVRYRTLKTYILAGPIIAAGKVYNDNGKIVATATTGSDGKFTFLFHDDFATGTIATGTLVKWGTGDVAVGSEANTSLGRFYQLQVGDPHYLNPSDELTTSATQFDVGTLVSLVRSYSVVVRALKFGIPGQPGGPVYLGSVRVQLLRRGRPPAVPATEGPANAWPRATIAIAPEHNPYEILGEGETKGDGSIQFLRLVKNVGPNDEYRVRLYTTEQSGLFYQTALLSYKQMWGLGTSKPFDYAAYNEQYNSGLQDTLVAMLIPRPPRLKVTVQREAQDGGAPILAGKVDLCYPGVCLRQWLDDDSSKTGTVVWHDVQPKAGAWRIDVVAPGYKPYTQSILSPQMGRADAYPVALVAEATLRGRIVDETGKPVGGKVRVANGPEKNATPVIVNHSLVGWQFTLASPSGPQPLHIEPPPHYLPLDTTITVAKGDNPVRTFTVLRELHRLRLLVRPYVASGANQMIKPPGQPGGGGSASGGGIAGATVTLKPKNGPTSEIQTKSTNAQGIVEFLWTNTSNDADLEVHGPADADYVVATPTTTVPVGKTTAFTLDTVYLEPGTRVSGRVYAGRTTDTPIPGARVSLVVDGAEVQTLTAPSGEYTLRSVPLGAQTVRAAKSQSPFVGEAVQVNAVKPGVTGVDFHLQFYEGINISRLLGFPLEVHSLETLPSNRIRISGALADAAPNPVFAPQTPNHVFGFDSVTVEAGPGNQAVPTAGSVLLSDADLELDVYGGFGAVQHQAGGLRARPVGGTGAVFAPIRMGPLPGVSQGQMSGVPDLYLLRPGATGEARTVLASLTADASAPIDAAGFNVGTQTGGAPHFQLIGFSSDVDPAGSFLRGDGLHLKATLHTDIPGAGDLALAVPDVHFIAGQGFKATPVDQPVAAKLGLWTIAATPWSVNVESGRVYLQKGEIKAIVDPTKPQSTIAFPFTGLEITPTGFSGGNFNAGPIKLAGFLPLDPSGPMSLTAAGGGDWKLITGGTLKGLPGTAPTDQVELAAFEVHSTKPPVLAAKLNQHVRFYDTGDFDVLAFYLTEAVSLAGKLDLHVPNLPKTDFVFRYEAGPGGLPKLVPPPLTFTAFDVGGPQLTLTNGTLDATGFKSAGSLAVPGKFTIPVSFLRDPLAASPSRIEATPTPAAQIALGEIVLTGLTGGAKAQNDAWSTTVNGALDVNGGQVTGTVSLGVAGADVTIGTAGLAVKQMTPSFKGLTMTINFPEQRIEGSGQFDTDIATGAHASGAAELAISGKPGNRYWYFFGGADFTLANPSLGGTAALLIGDAQLSGALLDKFASYSNKGIPESFYDIEGFFLGGKIEIPIPSCPNGSFDVGVASVVVWCKGWGDLRFGMNFKDNNVYFIGTEVGVKAGAKGGAGLGACLHVSGEVSTHAGMEGSYRSDGAWYVKGDYAFDLHGEVSGGVGIDDKCIEDSAGFTLGLGARAQLGKNFNDNTGPYFEVYKK